MSNPYNGVGFPEDLPFNQIIPNVYTIASGFPNGVGTDVGSSFDIVFPATATYKTANQFVTFSNFFDSQSFKASNPTPQNFDDFMKLYATFYGINPNDANFIADQGTMVNVLGQFYAINSSGDSGTNSPIPGVAADHPSFVSDLGKRAFSAFLKTLTYPTDFLNELGYGGIGGFNQQFTNYFLPAAVYKQDPNSTIELTALGGGIFGSNPPGSPNNYQSIFNAYLTNPDINDFKAQLAAYINSIQYAPNQTSNFVTASSGLAAWFSQQQAKYVQSLTGSPSTTQSSIASGGYDKTQILERILRLIVDMIGTMQKTTAAQSNHLRVLSDNQSAYTDLQGQIKVFLSGDGSTIGGANDKASQARQDVNAYNQNLTDTIRTRRGVIQDTAKAYQSLLNQSNDAVNQQTNMGTAILQELSTLLAAIYR